MTTKIDTLLFDLGNVLIPWDHTELVNSLLLLAHAEDRPQVKDLLKDLNDEYDLCRLDQCVAKKVAEFPQYKTIFEGYQSRWMDALGWPIEGTIEIIQQLKKTGCKIYAASNWARDTFESARPRMAFLELFDGIQISGDIGIRKPDHAFFQKMMETFHFSREQALFIDDKKANTEAAQQFGIKSVLFTDSEGLKLELVKLGFTCPGKSSMSTSTNKIFAPLLFVAFMLASPETLATSGSANIVHSTDIIKDQVPSNDTITDQFAGLRLNQNTSSVTVNAFPGASPNRCRIISNSSTNDYFVPIKSSDEWDAFVNNPPAGVNISTCTGVCGTANGGSFASLTAVSANLCSMGTAQNFSGSGPWSWNCGGNGFSLSQNCSAATSVVTSSGPGDGWTCNEDYCWSGGGGVWNSASDPRNIAIRCSLDPECGSSPEIGYSPP